MKTAQHTPGLCQKCQWVHTADSVKGTSFMGVKLCPLHAATHDLLAALKDLYVQSGNLSPLAGKTGIKGVRQAGKLIAARDKAAAAPAQTTKGAT